MRTKNEIKEDFKHYVDIDGYKQGNAEKLQLEILLDIRDLLINLNK